MAWAQQKIGNTYYGFDGTQWYVDGGEDGWVYTPSKPSGWTDTAQTQSMSSAAQQAAQQATQQASQQQSALQAGLTNGSIVPIWTESGLDRYEQINPNGTRTVLSTSGVPGGTYTPSSGSGFFGDMLGGLSNAVHSVTSDPVGLAMVAAMTGGALSNAGLLGAGATTGGLGTMASTVPTAAQWEAMAAAGAPVSAGAASAALPAAATGLLTSTAPEVAGATGLASLPSSVTPAAEAFGAGGGTVATDAAATAGASGVPSATTGMMTGATVPAAAATGAYDALLSGTTAGTTASSLIPGISNGQLLSTGLNLAGGLVSGQSASDAAQIQAAAQIRAAQIAADAAKFKPVGVTTGFGSSQFGFDANGNLTSAGYNLTPEMKAQRDALIGSSNGLLGQFTGSQAATAPMADAAQRSMTLGNQYLATDPQAQAAKYYADQMKLLEPGRADALAQLQAQMQAQGRGGFAIGGGVGGQGAANPQLQALYNAQLQQNNQLAANATQGGMDYAKFGAGLVGTGGDLLSSMYGTQTAAFNPYKTALGGAQTVEGLGQNALTLGMDMGKTATAASAASGLLQGQGISNAASTMAPANAYSPWGALLSGAGSTMSGYKFDPMTGKAL